MIKKNRFDLVFFRWMVLLLRRNCFWKKWHQSNHRLRSSHCQICLIPCIFDDFESFVDKNRFNMERLGKYYDVLVNELVKCFYDSQRSTEDFLGAKCYLWGRNWMTGECWWVSLLESIRYDDSIFLARIFLARLFDNSRGNFCCLIYGISSSIGEIISIEKPPSLSSSFLSSSSPFSVVPFSFYCILRFMFMF